MKTTVTTLDNTKSKSFLSMKRVALIAFCAVNAITAFEAGVSVWNERQNSLFELTDVELSRYSKFAISTGAGGWEGFMSSLGSAGYAEGVEPCATPLISCGLTGFFDGDRSPAPAQAFFQIAGSMGAMVGGAAVGFYDFAVGVKRAEDYTL